MTALRVISAIAANACDDLVIGDLAEQARQHRRIAGGVVGHLDCPDLQRRRINTQINLAPLATIVSAMLFGLLLAFAQHLNARAND
jgi:hypothetical protein